ncbi:hypothetical protein [Neptuniibacter sp.]|uniref:hypothetical protein n=1 Tax=Neptuniibacter sp. TaxID=1962643 RepID=UPI00260F692C|nr:hypothetical protein [Neptuniibacter sp.]MCP4597805.1 hypothetical protein [Neptuniibacter sp.]
MSTKKGSGLPVLAEAPANDDTLFIIDKSDIADAPTGKTKKITISYLFTGLVKYDDVVANFTGELRQNDSPVLVASDLGNSVQAHDPATAKTNQLTNFTAGLQYNGNTVLDTGDLGILVQPYNSAIPTQTATQQEMEEGTVAANRSMSPELVAQAIAALTGTAGGVRTFTADGAISAGDVVSLNTDSTVKTISAAENVTVNQFDVEITNSAVKPWQANIVYDSVNNKAAAFWVDNATDDPTVAVGTISAGGTIDWGTPVSIASGVDCYNCNADFDVANGKFAIFYDDYNGANDSYGIVGTISGDTMTFGNPQALTGTTSALGDSCHVVYDPAAGASAFIYAETPNGYGRAQVGTISGTDISFGAEATYSSAGNVIRANGACYDSSDEKVVISYEAAGNNQYGTSVVGSISGTDISFGSEVVFASAATKDVDCAYDAVANKTMVTFVDDAASDHAKYIIGDVSGAAITFNGSEGTIKSVDTEEMRVVSNPVTGTMGVIFQNNVANDAEITFGTIVGDSASFTTPEVVKNYTTTVDRLSICYSSADDKYIVTYDAGGGLDSGLIDYELTTTADDYIGIAVEAISDTASGEINIIGGVNAQQSGLTTGAKYYVSSTGALTTSDTGRPIGRALSSTEILINN